MKLWGSSDIGVVRQENQDTYMLHELEDGALLVVCDGMGGAKGGSTASSTASHAFAEAVEQGYQKNMKPSEMADLVALAATKANAAVYQAARQDPSLSGMGTTLVCLLAQGMDAIVGNIGDSRAYLIDEEGMRQVTHDHSLVAEMVRRGELSSREASRHPNKNVINPRPGRGEQCFLRRVSAVAEKRPVCAALFRWADQRGQRTGDLLRGVSIPGA